MPVPVSLGTAWKRPHKAPTSHKLSPPRLEGLVSRSRLLRKMEEVGRVVTIVGPATSGKTSLAASWTNSDFVAVQGINVFWYQISSADGDVATFFELIDGALGSGKPFDPKQPSYSAEAHSELASFTVTWFKSLSASIARPIAFIFDDLHLLSSNSPLLVVITKIARAIGDKNYLILTSRENIPSRVTDAARRQRKLVRITDLKVDESEYPDFAQAAGNSEPLTRSAFLVALESANHSLANLPLTNILGLPAHMVRQKVASVLSGLTNAERAAVRATAYLQVGYQRDWAHLGGELAADVFSDLSKNSGLVRRLQNNALFKHDVLHEEIKAWTEQSASLQEISKYQLETGRFLVDQGDVFGGVLLLVAAEAFEETEAVILNHASDLIDRAKNIELSNIIQALPPEQRARPAMQLWAAYARLPFAPDEASRELAAIRAEHQQALSVSERALAINGEIYGALTTMVIDDRMPPLIEAATALMIELTAVQEPMRSRLYIGRLVAILLGAPSHRDHAEIREEAQAQLPDLSPESRLILGAALVTHLLWWEGDVEAARKLHDQLSGQAHQVEAAHLPVMSWHIGALSLAFRDGDEKAITKALREIEHFARHRGLDSRLGPAYWVATQAYAALGNSVEVTRSLERHLSLVQDMRVLHEHEEHFLRSTVALGNGAFSEAAREANLGRSIADGRGALQGRHLNALALAMSLAFRGDEAARRAIQEVAQVGETTGNRIFLLHAALAGAALTHAKQRWDDFGAAWQDVTRISLATKIRLLTGFNVDAVGRLARDALVREIEPKATSQLIVLWRLLPPADKATIAAWPYLMKVDCLGRSEIDVTTSGALGNRRPVKMRDKGTNLLIHLVTAGSRGISAATLADALWPDAETRDQANNLRQQISYLRSIATFAGIVFKDGLYSLNNRLVMTDVQRLNEAIAIMADRGTVLSDRIVAFDLALDLYRGPLLPDVDSDLVFDYRNELAKQLKTKATGFLKVLGQSDAAQAEKRYSRLTKLLAQA
jgi:LuxR family maltose regulon positive regulatory protein